FTFFVYFFMDSAITLCYTLSLHDALPIFTWLSHSGFSLDINGTKVLFDPFLSGSPLAPMSRDDIEVDYIILTHGHSDHSIDTPRSEEHTSELQSRENLVCRLLLEKKKIYT